jgi:hypothetical protein
VILPPYLRIPLRLLIRTVLVLVFIGIPAVVYYLTYHGLPPAAIQRVVSALQSPDFSVRIGKITLPPLLGLVAEELVVRERATGRQVEVDRAVISLDLSALVRGRVEVQGVRLQRAELALPLEDGEELRIRDLDANVLVSPGWLHLPQCTFALGVLDVSLAGSFRTGSPAGVVEMRPAKTENEPPQKGEPLELPDWLNEAGRFLNELRVTGRNPRLDATFSGALDSLESFHVDHLRLVSEGIGWREVSLTRVDLEASFRQGVVNLSRLEAQDSSGRLTAAGEFSVSEEKGQLKVLSNLEPVPWLQVMNMAGNLDEASLSSAPGIEASVEFELREGRVDLRALGSVHAADFSFKEVEIERFLCQWAWRDGRFLAREVQIVSPAVDGVLDALVEEETAHVRFEGRVDPTLIKPWVDPSARKILENLVVEEAADLQIAVSWPLRESALIEGNGKARLGRSAMHGAWIDGADASFRLENRAVAYDELEVRQNGGTGRARLVYDMGRREIRLESVESTLMPADILPWIDLGIARTVAEYRFRSAPQTKVQGRVDMADPRGNDLKIEVRGTGGLDYDLLERTLRFGSTQADLRVRGFELLVDVPRASIFDGWARIRAEVSLDPADPTYQANISLERVDFAALTKLYFDYDSSKGSMNAGFQFRANMKDQTNLVGSGNLEIVEGNVFAIPILGPFSAILGEILPGIGYQNARRATADFEVARQTITTRNLEIEGQGFSMYGEGSIFFMQDRMDMSIRINAKGIPGIVLFPFSKLFEYTSDGPLSGPVWRPKRVPRQILSLPSLTTGGRER